MAFKSGAQNRFFHSGLAKQKLGQQTTVTQNPFKLQEQAAKEFKTKPMLFQKIKLKLGKY